MKPYDEHTCLAEAVLKNAGLLPLIVRFGILPGFGNASIGELCVQRSIPVDFMLYILNSFCREPYAEKVSKCRFALESLVDYLRKSHIDILDLIEEMEDRLDQMLATCEPPQDSLSFLRNHFGGFRDNLIRHILHEEEHLFPCLGLLSMAEGEFPRLLTGDITFSQKSIETFHLEHLQIEEALQDMKTLIIKYLPANYERKAGLRFISLLYQIEKELVFHAHIEETMLNSKGKELMTRMGMNADE